MKINDLKKELKNAQTGDIKKALIETYKQLSASQRAQWDDELLATLRHEPAPALDPDALFFEIGRFCDQATQGLYRMPNRVVSKAEQARWRVQVQHYFKALDAITPDDEAFAQSAAVMEKLVSTLSYAAKYALFNTASPFAALRQSQLSLFATAIHRRLALGATRQNLNAVCDWFARLVIEPQGSAGRLADALVAQVKTMPAREFLREIAKEKRQNMPDRARRRLDLLAFFLDESLDMTAEGVETYWQDEPGQTEILDFLFELYEAGHLDAWRLAFAYATKRYGFTPSANMARRYERLCETRQGNGV
ncbi:hypothetical protein [uncultured Dubosiella sp.]|uniref:hypothetical protein n=1 Tax=uncultured Dubosiella sp. TaxID=1937011 RepID=UPI00273170D1|nr:hypothetical protein [uncultured Dubosiella sp.]